MSCIISYVSVTLLVGLSVIFWLVSKNDSICHDISFDIYLSVCLSAFQSVCVSIYYLKWFALYANSFHSCIHLLMCWLFFLFLINSFCCYWFCLESAVNPFEVHPNYKFWAPYIGQRTRGNVVYNTEHRKCRVSFNPDKDGLSADQLTIDKLMEVFSEGKVRMFKSLHEHC